MDDKEKVCGDVSCGETSCEGCASAASQQPAEEGCSSDCSSCPSAGNCGSQPQSFLEETNSFNDIKKVIGIVSGKGGVGKSLVTSLMAVNMQRKGYKTAIQDCLYRRLSVPERRLQPASWAYFL